MSEPAAWIDIPAHDAVTTLARARQLGGTVVMPPWTIPGMGTMAVALDPEGNRVGLWTRPAQKSGSPA